MAFLILWLELTLAMLIALAAVAIIYRLLGSDFPTKFDSFNDVGGWVEEIIAAVCIGAIAAGVMWLDLRFGMDGWLYIVGYILIGMGYLATHVPEADKLEASVYTLVFVAVILLMWFLIDVLVGPEVAIEAV